MSYKQDLLDLINRDNGTTLTLEDLIFGNPSPATPDVEGGIQNTQIKVFGVESQGLAGQFVFKYRRIDLARLFVGREPVAQVPAGTALLADVLTSLSERYGIALPVAEFMWQPPVEGSNVGTVTPIPTSLYWAPVSLDVTLVEKMVDLSTDIATTSLPGFAYAPINPWVL